MKKRIVSAALCSALIITAVLFAACNKQTAEPQTGTSVVAHTEVVSETQLVSEVVTDESGSTQIESSVAEITKIVEVTEIVTVTVKNNETRAAASSQAQSTAAENTPSASVTVAEMTEKTGGTNPPQLMSASNPNPNGSYASVVVMGTAGTEYTLSSDFSSNGMITATASESGIVSWSFEIPADVADGEHIVTISDNASNTLQFNLTVS